MSPRVLSSGVVALGVVLLTVSSALAQRNFNPGMRPVKYSGTLTTVEQNRIQLSTNTNQTILVMIGSDAEVSVTGTADKEYLNSKSKLIVEFVADVDKGDKGFMVKDKLDHLTIVTPTADRPVGLSAAEFATPEKKGEKGDKPKAKEVQADPPAPAAGEAAPAAPRKARGKKADDLFADDSSAGKPGKGRNSALKPPGTFTVRGTIKMGQNGLITVMAGHWAIKAKLADDATIDVNMADIHFAQPDDQVTVSGAANPMRPNVVVAESVKIELAKPLTGVKKHAAHSTKAKKDAPTADDLFGGKK